MTYAAPDCSRLRGTRASAGSMDLAALNNFTPRLVQGTAGKLSPQHCRRSHCSEKTGHDTKKPPVLTRTPSLRLAPPLPVS